MKRQFLMLLSTLFLVVALAGCASTATEKQSDEMLPDISVKAGPLQVSSHDELESVHTNVAKKSMI